MKKYDGWIIKSILGELLLWSFRRTRKKLIAELDGEHGNYQDWKDDGHKIVKIKLMEV